MSHQNFGNEDQENPMFHQKITKKSTSFTDLRKINMHLHDKLQKRKTSFQKSFVIKSNFSAMCIMKKKKQKDTSLLIFSKNTCTHNQMQ